MFKVLRGGFIMNYTTPDIEVIAVKNDLVASASSQTDKDGERD